MKIIDDKTLIRKLASQDSREVNEASIYLERESFPGIERLVIRNSGTKEDAKDIWQDTMMAINLQLGSGKLSVENLSCKLNTYFFTVAKNLWLNTLRKHKKELPINETHTRHLSKNAEVLHRLVCTDRKNAIKEVLELLEPNSRKVLILFYYERWSTESIANEMGYANAQVAKNKLYKAKQTIKSLINKQFERTDFIND